MSRILLVGPPNAGKTTLFNALTNSREKTGNFHGVTATVATANYTYKGKIFCVSDLPGIYDLTPYSLEEKTAIEELKGEYDCILCVIEAVYPLAAITLLQQLKSTNKPIIAVITKCKLHKKRGGSFDTELFQRLSGVSAMEVDGNEVEPLKERLLNLERGKDFDFDCNRVLNMVYTPSKRGKADKLFLNPFFCVAFCLALFSLVIFSVFAKISPVYMCSQLLQKGFSSISLIVEEKLLILGVSEFVITVITRGLEAFGAVLGFIPQLVALNLFMMIIEESGIAERYSLHLGKYLRRLGLSGKSVFPLVSCLGCTAVSCKLSNTAESEDIKRRTISSMAYLPCSAKNAVLIFLCSRVFRQSVLVLILVYLICVALLVLNAIIIQRIKPVNECLKVYSLSPFTFPNMRKVIKGSIDSACLFFKKISLSVLLVGITIGILTSVTIDFNYTSNLQESILCALGKKIAVIFKPIGLGDWKLIVSLISGLFAKETTLGVIEILYGESFYLSSVQGVCFITFFALYPPCFVAISSMQENAKIGVIVAIKHLVLGYIGAFFVNILLTKGVLFSIIFLGIIFGCLICYEIIYCKRKRKTFTRVGKGGRGLRSMSKTPSQKRYKNKR